MSKLHRRAVAISLCLAATAASCAPSSLSRRSIPLETWTEYHAAARCIQNHVVELIQLAGNSDGLYIFVGHAYGTSNEENGMLGKELQDFINSVDGTKVKLIFLGDVFEKVSEEKVQHLGSQLATLDVFLAPGNHDEYDISASWWTGASFLPPARYEFDGFLLYLLDTTNAHSAEMIMSTENGTQVKPSVIAGHHVLYRNAANSDLQGNLSPYGPAQAVFGDEEYFSAFEAVPTVFFSGDAVQQRPLQCVRYGDHVSVATALYGTFLDSVVVLDFQRVAAYPCFLSETLKRCTERQT